MSNCTFASSSWHRRHGGRNNATAGYEATGFGRGKELDGGEEEFRIRDPDTEPHTSTTDTITDTYPELQEELCGRIRGEAGACYWQALGAEEEEGGFLQVDVEAAVCQRYCGHWVYGLWDLCESEPGGSEGSRSEQEDACGAW